MKLNQEQAMQMIIDGMSYREVAEHFSCSQSNLIHCFGPEYGCYKKKKKVFAIEDKILDAYRNRIKDAIVVAASRDDYGKRIKEILGSLQAVLYSLFEPRDSQAG